MSKNVSVSCCIGNDFYTLKSRVERDTKAQQIFEEMKKRERAERVRQLRREREEREKEYATEHPEFLRCDSDIDLFKPTDIVLRENERRKQRMDKDIDRIFLRTHIEQKKPDIQNQFSNASERKFDDSICTEPYSVLSYIPPTEKEIDSVQQLSDCEDSDFNEKKNDTFGVIACNQIVPHNISNPDLETQEMPGPSHPIHGKITPISDESNRLSIYTIGNGVAWRIPNFQRNPKVVPQGENDRNVAWQSPKFWKNPKLAPQGENHTDGNTTRLLFDISSVFLQSIFTHKY
ncbi:uncharacterized protein ACOB8E_018706 isoform 3-T4 [Sarcophilus harrisii]